jgi:hypothetical protein
MELHQSRLGISTHHTALADVAAASSVVAAATSASIAAEARGRHRSSDLLGTIRLSCA